MRSRAARRCRGISSNDRDRLMQTTKQPVKGSSSDGPPTALGYGRQSIAPQDIEAVIAVLRSDYLTQGPRSNASRQR